MIELHFVDMTPPVGYTIIYDTKYPFMSTMALILDHQYYDIYFYSASEDMHIGMGSVCVNVWLQTAV